MLSRTADHLFWMARYIERAENAAKRRFAEGKAPRRATARAVFSAVEARHAV